MSILIAGGGISGLSSAYHLIQKNIHQFILLEKNSEIGGIARSIKTPDNFVFDFASHILFTKSEYVKKMYNEFLGDNKLELKRNAWIYSKNCYTRYPFQVNTYGLPLTTKLDCILNFIKAKCSKKETDNFHDWIHKVFGNGIARHFFIPYNQKLWRFPLSDITHSWVSDRIIQPTLFEILRGAVTDCKKGSALNSNFLYPKKGGIGVIAEKMFDFLGDSKSNILTRSKIVKIIPDSNLIILENGDCYTYEKLIFTLSLHLLGKLIGGKLPNEVSLAVNRLRYVRLFCLNFAIPKNKLNKMMRIYLPEYNFYSHRIGFPTFISENNAPPNYTSLYAEVSQIGSDPTFPMEKDMVERIVSDIIKLGLVDSEEEIDYKGRLVLDPAYVVFTKTHQEDVNIIHEYLKKNNIFPAGRYADWSYYNIDHCILSAKKTIDKCIAF